MSQRDDSGTTAEWHAAADEIMDLTGLASRDAVVGQALFEYRAILDRERIIQACTRDIAHEEEI